MDQIVELICTAVRKSDYAEVRRILEAVASMPTTTKVVSIAANDDPVGDRVARLRKQFEEDDAA